MPRPIKATQIVTVACSLKTFFTGQRASLRERGFDLRVVSSPGEELDAFAVDQQAPVDGVPMHRAVSPLRDLFSLGGLIRVLLRDRPTIVHAHTPKAGLVGMIAAWLTRRPLRIYHFRGLPLETATGLKRWLLALSEKTACRLAHRVLCVSHSLRDRVIELGLCPANKIAVLANGSGNGVDSSQRFNPAELPPNIGSDLRQQLGVPGKAVVIGYVGRLVSDKGVRELAAAWNALRADFPAAYLLLVGLPDKRDAIPAEILQRLAVDSRVRIAPPTTQIASHYAAMDLVALPTYREGLPNVLLEAAAMAKPVVATRTTGCIDVVAEDVTGLLVPVADAPALADALRRYLSDAQLRRRHGQAARKRVVQQYHPTIVWKALADEYQRLLASRTITHDTAAAVRPAA